MGGLYEGRGTSAADTRPPGADIKRWLGGSLGKRVAYKGWSLRITACTVGNCRRPVAADERARSGSGALSQFWKDNPFLGLVFAFAVGIAGFANFVGLEEDDLA